MGNIYILINSPIHLAALEGHLSVVEFLVNQKADLNSKNGSFKMLFIIKLLFTKLF